MRKKLLAGLLAACLALALLPGSALAAETAAGTCGESLTWSLDDAGILTVSGTGDMAEWDFVSDRPWDAYAEDVTSVVIGDSVVSITCNAFIGFENLSEVRFGNQLVSIGPDAFNRTTLTSVTIPATVAFIGSGAFGNCGSLAEISVDGGNPVYRDIDGVLIDEGNHSLQQYPAGKRNTSYTVPADVSVIADWAFGGCQNLENVEIPEHVAEIGQWAFSECTALKSVIFTTPSAITHIGAHAFRMCESLESIEIPPIETIEGGVFSMCNSLVNITIPDTVTTVNYGAFSYCMNLESVSIPASVVSLDGNAFESCPKLREISIADGNADFVSVDRVLFNQSQTHLVKYPAGKQEAPTQSRILLQTLAPTLFPAAVRSLK